MTVLIVCRDQPGSAPLRAKLRPAHLEYVRAHLHQVRLAGPLLDTGGGSQGSFYVIDAADTHGARSLLASDPYHRGGLFASVEIETVNVVVRDGTFVPEVQPGDRGGS